MRFVFIGLVLIITNALRADPPADLSSHLPAKTLACIDWAGADAWRSALPETAVGKTLAEPDVKAFIDLALHELTDDLRRRIAQSGGPAAQLGEPLIQLGGTLWRRPWAVAFLEPPSSEPGPQIGFILRPGDDMPAVKQLVERLIALMKKAEVPVKPLGQNGDAAKWSTLQTAPDSPLVAWSISGDLFALALGKSAAESLSASLAGGAHLQDQPAFKAVVEGLAAPPAGRIATFFFDTERLRKIASMSDPGMQIFGNTLGVYAIAGVGGSLTLADGGYRSAVYLHAPGARRGLMQMFVAAPISDEALMTIPRDALFAYAGNLNLAALAGGSASASAPAEGLPINPLMLFPATRTAAPAIGELLDSIGTAWCLYLSPDSAGVSLLGLTACVDVKDEDRARRALTRIVEGFDESGGEGALRIRTTKIDGRQVSYVHARGRGLPVAPAWGVARGRLVLALYPQNVAAALARLETGMSRENAILSNPAFMQARARVPADCGAIAFYDTPGSMGRLYDVALPMIQSWLSGLPGGGSSVDIASLPSRASVTKHMFPSISATRVSDRGVLMVARTSLPLLNPSLAEAMVVGPALAGAALPLWSRAEASADRQVGMRRLKHMGMACYSFAQENDDRLPASLEQLHRYLSPAEAAADCTLISGFPAVSKVTKPAERVLIYENPQRYNATGTCVLYVDGHVQWRAMQAFQSDLRATQDYLKKP